MKGKETKYDRQLRLWGRDGQKSLAASRAVVLGATATSAELLKNIVLPGIGYFTIVDDAVTGPEAMGHNFFVGRDDYVAQKPIAEAMVRNLAELNEHSVGHACVQSCASWISAFVNGFPPNTNDEADPTRISNPEEQGWPTIVIATPRVSPPDLRLLASHLRPSGTPLLFVQSVGLAGIVLVQCGERMIIDAEPKPETRVADLRLFDPFPALREWLDAHDPTDVSAASLEPPHHLPWIAILYHALRHLRAECGDPCFIPRTSKDYAELRRVISARMPQSASRVSDGFAEALEKCRTALNRPGALPAESQAVLQKSLVAVMDPRWAVARGIARFIELHGVPPLSGYVPDMATTTQWYRELCTIYAAKHDADCAEVCAYAMDAMRAAEELEPDHSFIAAVTRAMVKNLWTLQVLRFEPVFCRGDDNIDNSQSDSNSNDKDNDALPLLLQGPRFQHYFNGCSAPQEYFTVALLAALLAARCFEERTGVPPGVNHSDGIHSHKNNRHNDDGSSTDLSWVSDAEALELIVDAALDTSGRKRERGGRGECISQACAEVSRAGAGEPAATAIIMGAAAAQECIKLVQHRRVPVNHPLVFDGYRNCFWIAPPLRDLQ